MLRVVLVEDDASLAEAMKALLEQASPRIEVAGVFHRAQSALEMLPTLKFEVALIDLHLPDGSGIEVVRGVRVIQPEAHPVVMTVFEDPKTVFAAIRAGAHGYLLKGGTPAELVTNVREAAAGGAPMSPRVARYVLDAVKSLPQAELSEELTARESEVLTLLCEGHTYREVATAMTLQLGTVQTYVKSIYRKLEVGSKAELAAAAFRRGLMT